MNFAASALHTNAGIRDRKASSSVSLAPRVQPILSEAERAVHRREKAALQEKINALRSRCDVLELRLSVYEDVKPIAPRPSGYEVANAVAVANNVTFEHLRSPSRNRSLADIRQNAMYEVRRQCPQLSLVQIGRLFSRDHTTCLHAIREWPAKAAKLGIHVHPLGRERSGE